MRERRSSVGIRVGMMTILPPIAVGVVIFCISKEATVSISSRIWVYHWRAALKLEMITLDYLKRYQMRLKSRTGHIWDIHAYAL